MKRAPVRDRQGEDKPSPLQYTGTPMKRAPVRDTLWLFLLTRVALVLVTYVGYILLISPKYAMAGVNVQALLGSWNRWDAANYVRIAQFGYQTRFDVAFFPLYPLLISILAHPFGSNAYLTVATLISNLALLGAMFMLYQLAVEIGGEHIARRTLLYLLIFPTAFFFFAAYNESLFLFLTTASFVALRRQRWWLAALLGFFASLTRSAGLFLVIPYLYELWLSEGNLRTKLFRLAPIVLIPLGLALYSVYCWQIRGDPFAYATLQYHWGRYLTFPGEAIVLAFYQIFWAQPFASFFEVHNLLDLSATLAFIVLAVLGWRKMRMSYNLWLVMMIVYVLLSPTITQPDPLISNQRFILEMFPIFITLACLGEKHPRLHQGIVLIFPPLLAILGILFVMNKWMV